MGVFQDGLSDKNCFWSFKFSQSWRHCNINIYQSSYTDIENAWRRATPKTKTIAHYIQWVYSRNLHVNFHKKIKGYRLKFFHKSFNCYMSPSKPRFVFKIRQFLFINIQFVSFSWITVSIYGVFNIILIWLGLTKLI